MPTPRATALAATAGILAVAIPFVSAATGSERTTGTTDVTQAATDGVSVEARILPGAAVLCIDADSGLKISAQYGVEVRVDPNEASLWNESFPKLITGPNADFELPLKITLETSGTMQERRVSLDLGACSASEQTCTPIKLRMTMPQRLSLQNAGSWCEAASGKSG